MNDSDTRVGVDYDLIKRSLPKEMKKAKIKKLKEVVLSKHQIRYQTDVEFRERCKEHQRKSYAKKQEATVPDYSAKKEAREEVSRQLKLAARRKAYAKRKDKL